MQYGVAADALIPHLDDAARVGIFDAMVELHQENARAQEHEQQVAELKSRFGGA